MRPKRKRSQVVKGANISFPATVAKNEFGRVLEAALERGTVVITKHDAPKAVLLSMEAYRALAGRTESVLDALTGEFDAMFERMQTPGARKARNALFAATPAELGRAAAAAARKGG
jgi:prevent-host-death family protein